MQMLLQARVEREKHFEASLKSPDGIVVPREFLQHTQHAAPASARTNKFHIRGYKGAAFDHFSTKSRVLFFQCISNFRLCSSMRIVVSNLAGHISGAVHFCGESFTRISEKALMGKHLETLCVNEYSNFSCEQNCAHVCALFFRVVV